MRKKFLLSKVADIAGLHSECIMGNTVLELCNDERVLVENIHHVISFDTNRIVLAASFGNICLDGYDLIFDYLGENKILIKGTLLHISLFQEDGRK